MQSSPCETILIATSDYRESDKLLTLFTREHGKVRAVARGAKTSIRRFGGMLEIFARLNVQLVLREGLSTLREADAVTLYPHIRGDLLKIGLAGYACELVDNLAPEGMANERLFRLLSAYLGRLDSAQVMMSDRRFFEINLLNILGYRPALDHCSECGADLPAGTANRAVDASGSLFCLDCGRGGRIVSAGTVFLLDRALRSGRFEVLALAGRELEEAGRLLDDAISSHLPRPLRSVAFLLEIAE